MATTNRPSKCIFCDIVDGKMPTTKMVFENENILIFHDIKPASDFHYLAIPRVHIDNAKSLSVDHKELVIEMWEKLKESIEKENIPLSDVNFGFHWPPFNSVNHLHMHCIAPVSKMGFISRNVYKPDSVWFKTVDFVLSTHLCDGVAMNN